MGKWTHVLLEHSGDSGICAACGPVRVAMKSLGNGRRGPRCWNAIQIQRDPRLRNQPLELIGPGFTPRYTPEKMHGLTSAEARAYREGKSCEICGATDRLHVDHAHDAPGEIRGVLCRECNLGLGHFRDNPQRLRAAADYLCR